MFYGGGVMAFDRLFFFFSSRRRHTRLQGDWSSDVCSSDLVMQQKRPGIHWGQIVSVVLMLMLSALAVGIVLGYVYTATEFIQALMASFVFLGAVEVVVNLLRRWLLLGERRLALNRLREAARLAQSGSGVDKI